MTEMISTPAVSAPTPTRTRRYCLLNSAEAEAYRCAETAAALAANQTQARIDAYWLHYRTHLAAYLHWAGRRRYFDPALNALGPEEAAAELVIPVCESFYERVRDGGYEPERGYPCHYLRRAIKNRYQDLLRRGRHPTQPECRRCWHEHGNSCPVFGGSTNESQLQHCFQPPQFQSLETTTALYEAITLQEEWPPLLGEATTAETLRPVEEAALNHVLWATIEMLILTLLTPDQQIVLAATFESEQSSAEIAQRLQTTPDNVDHIRRRGLQRLYRALTEPGGTSRTR